MVTMLSQLTTDSWPMPLSGPAGTSVDRPRTVAVIGATVTCCRWGSTSSRVSTRTGRALSRWATWIGLTGRVYRVPGHVPDECGKVRVLAGFGENRGIPGRHLAAAFAFQLARRRP